MTNKDGDLASFDLATAMKQLYTNGDYFVKLPPRSSHDLDRDYWSESQDPDGIQRNRLDEKRKYLNNLGHEIAFIDSLEPGKVLDIGCGPGWLLSTIDDAWSKHGVEPSTQASAHASRHGEIFVGPFEKTTHPANFFDLIIAYHVIEHLEDPLSALKKIRDTLKPGGSLLLGTPDFDSGCARRFGSDYRLLHDPTHISLFSNDSMHRFLRENGFRITSVDYPFFETTWFTRSNLLRILRKEQTSPPFYGNFMTFYCSKL